MTDTGKRILVLGAGRAGTTLARALRLSGSDVRLHGRQARHRHGEPPRVQGMDDVQVTAGPLPRDTTAILVAVRDAQLDEALGEIAAAGLGSSVPVLHLSGASDPRGPGARMLRLQGHPFGTFHPLAPLAGDPGVLRGAWVGIDGDDEARRLARVVAERIGANVLDIPRGRKSRYHAAAVFASNFPVTLAAAAERLFTEAGIPATAARAAAAALMAAAVENLRRLPPGEALTGPIARGDDATVRRHIEALQDDPLMTALYATLGAATLELAREQGILDPQRAEAIARALADAAK